MKENERVERFRSISHSKMRNKKNINKETCVIIHNEKSHHKEMVEPYISVGRRREQSFE